TYSDKDYDRHRKRVDKDRKREKKKSKKKKTRSRSRSPSRSRSRSHSHNRSRTRTRSRSRIRNKSRSRSANRNRHRGRERNKETTNDKQPENEGTISKNSGYLEQDRIISGSESLSSGSRTNSEPASIPSPTPTPDQVKSNVAYLTTHAETDNPTAIFNGISINNNSKVKSIDNDIKPTSTANKEKGDEGTHLNRFKEDRDKERQRDTRKRKGKNRSRSRSRSRKTKEKKTVRSLKIDFMGVNFFQLFRLFLLKNENQKHGHFLIFKCELRKYNDRNRSYFF
ncbi:hypothetical protein RFI_30025, partial [Reticulomyxa filosa]